MPPATNQTTAPAETIPLPERQESRQNRRIKPSPLPTTQRSCFGRYRNIRSRHTRTTALWPILHPPELSRPAAPVLSSTHSALSCRNVKRSFTQTGPRRTSTTLPASSGKNSSARSPSRPKTTKDANPSRPPASCTRTPLSNTRIQASCTILNVYPAAARQPCPSLSPPIRPSVPPETAHEATSPDNTTTDSQPAFMSFLHTPEHVLSPENPRTPGRTIASRLWTSYRTPPPEHAIITTWKNDKSTGVNSTTSSSSPTPRTSEKPRKTVFPQPPARRHPAPNRPGHHTICNSGNGRPSPSVSERPVTQNPIRS